MSAAFAARYPVLFHVTRRSAVEGVKSRGLMPASVLAAAAGYAAGSNRNAWTHHSDPDGRPVWLRWQSMRDHVLASRLPKEIEPAQWRAFINAMVFLFASAREAERLKASPADAGIEQVVLSWRTASLIEHGSDLRVCRWNNGYPDRSRPKRMRTYDDYRPIAQWQRGDKVQEVTVSGGIPPDIPFTLL